MEDRRAGDELGVTATPTFFFAEVHDDGKLSLLAKLSGVWLFFVGHPEGFGERHGKSYLTRRRRGEEGGGGGSVTGGTVPSV